MTESSPPPSRTITLYHPAKHFASFSITGQACARNCAHCGGHYLKGMEPVASPEELLEKCLAFHREGGVGALVSGGCNADGKIEFGPYLRVLDQLARLPDFRLNVHTGFLDRARAEELARIPFDAVSMDMVGSQRTLEQVYGLPHSPQIYHEVLEAFASAGRMVSPHICVGLHFGKLLGEKAAIDILASHKETVHKLIFIVLIPTKGTGMATVSSPSTDEMVEIVSYARERLDCPLVLGCMRPRDPALELAVVEAGVDGLVNPTSSGRKATIAWAREQGWTLLNEDGCCCF